MHESSFGILENVKISGKLETAAPARRSPGGFFIEGYVTDKESAEALANRLSQAWNGKAQFWVERRIVELEDAPRYIYEVKSDMVNGLPAGGRVMFSKDIGL